MKAQGSKGGAKGGGELSQLALLLISRACDNEEVANFLFWYLKLEAEVGHAGRRRLRLRAGASSCWRPFLSLSAVVVVVVVVVGVLCSVWYLTLCIFADGGIRQDLCPCKS